MLTIDQCTTGWKELGRGEGHSVSVCPQHPTAVVCSEYTSIDVNAKMAPGKRKHPMPTTKN